MCRIENIKSDPRGSFRSNCILGGQFFAAGWAIFLDLLAMAVQFQEDDAQHSLRVGDTVLLYAKETSGYVFSELSRYSRTIIITKMYFTNFLHIYSEQHNSVALFKVDSFKDPSLPNVHCKYFGIC